MRLFRNALCCFVAAVSCTAATAAGAAWSKWYPIGGGIKGEPSIVTYNGYSPEVGVVVRGNNDSMWVSRSYDGKAFNQWSDLGGILTSAPSCVSIEKHRLNCYVRGKNNGLYEKGLFKGIWSDWIDHGGKLVAGPAAAGKVGEFIEVYAADTNESLVSTRWNGPGGVAPGWSGWMNHALPVPSKSEIECDQSPGGNQGYQVGDGFIQDYRMLCLSRGPDNKTTGYEFWLRDTIVGPPELGSWSGKVVEMPESKFRPDVILTSETEGRIFVTAMDGRLKTATWKTGVGFTSGWETIGDGLLSSGPSCHKPLSAAGLDYSIICAGRGMKGDVWLVRLLK